MQYAKEGFFLSKRAKTCAIGGRTVKNRVFGAAMMTVAALIWGVAFVAQSKGMETIGPFTFSGIRILMGALFLLPVAVIKDFYKKKTALATRKTEKRRFFTKRELLFGTLMGIAFAVACNFQQYSLLYTTPGKAAFITALYIVFVPVSGIFMKKKVSPIVWGSVALAFFGLYMLCVSPEEKGVQLGDALALCGSVFFTVQIMLIEQSGEEVDGVKLSLIQFLVCGLLSVILMFVFEEPTLQNIYSALPTLLYAGILSGGVAYTLQIISQKQLDAVVASLLMSLESVFAVLAAWIFMQQGMSTREIIGCIVMFTAIILVQTADVLMGKIKRR